MDDSDLRLTYIGGPTALIEIGGLRFLTDPTFDPAGSRYPTSEYVLRKTQGPALPPAGLGELTAVLVSHGHHFDNLDHAGRELLAHAPLVLTTVAGATALGGRAQGLALWQTVKLTGPSGDEVSLTAVPARHGPADGDRGPVIGFVLRLGSCPQSAVYISGDTVWYDGVEEVGRRFPIRVAVLNMGAAMVAVAGPHHLTLTAAEGVRLAEAWPGAVVVPLHYEGWEHFTEGRAEIEASFEERGLLTRLCWLTPGVPQAIALAAL